MPKNIIPFLFFSFLFILVNNLYEKHIPKYKCGVDSNINQPPEEAIYESDINFENLKNFNLISKDDFKDFDIF